METMLGWLEALRRHDRSAMAAVVHEDVVWEGVREDLVCRGRDEVLDTFLEARDQHFEIEALELLGGKDCVVLGVCRPGLREIGGVELYGQIHNAFDFREGVIVGIRDYRTRREALKAAGLAAPAWR